MVEEAIKRINEQIEKSKDGNVRSCGYQLTDIIKSTPGAAELVLRDLDRDGMSISDCEKKIHEEWKKNNSIDSRQADKVIREFYGIPETSEHAQAATVNKKHSIVDLDDFFK